MSRVQHRMYHSRQEQFDRIRHALDGQDAMRENASLYLRRPEGLTANEWNHFVRGGHFYPVAEHTLRAMCGLAFRKSPNVKVPSRLEPMLKNLSYDGNPFNVVAEQILREVLSVGRFCALLDFPPEGNTSLSVPYLSLFSAEDIRDWEMGVVNGTKRLTMLRLHEFNEDLEDTVTEQHLLLTLEPMLTIRRMHVSGKNEVQVEDDILPIVRGATLDYIPAVIFGPYNLAPDTEKPPMLDLVDVNISHWESSTNLEHALWMSAMPTPVIVGNVNARDKPSAVGPSIIWNLPEGSSAFYLTAPSDAHASLRLAIQDKEARLAALGASMILSGQRRNEAAETAHMRYQNDTSVLMSSINMVEAGLRMLLTWAADWVQPGEVIVEFNRDLVSAEMDPATIQALLKAQMAGSISRETFIDALRRGEIITRSTEEELALIEEDAPDMEKFISIR
jgi:Domain of unknown function (DUF4055)